MNNIIIVEDDKDVAELLKLYLENNNFRVFTAENGIDALEVLKKEEINLAIVDLMMPKMGGTVLIKKIREFSIMPIIVLSAKNQTEEKILCLNLGADDYMTKPFNALEVVARVNTCLRRAYKMSGNGDSSAEIIVGDLVLDTEKMKLIVAGEEVELTSTEYKIILTMIKQPGRVFTKAQLYEGINGEYFQNDDNTMMVHISKLRDKMGDREYIKTVRGLGYKLEAKTKQHEKD